jgi:hypothetical protein
MKIRFLAAAAIAAIATAGAANAAITISSYTGNYIQAGWTLITDFDSDQNGLIVASGYGFTQNYNAFTRDGGLGLADGVSAPPPLNGPANPLSPAPNGKNYETVLGNGLATLTSAAGFKRFSFYMGSPDTYNQVRITYSDNTVDPLGGTAIWGGNPPGNGDQTFGTTVVYNFGGKTATKIEFFNNPTTNAFEFDRLAASTAVPEPATWALMIGGFGLMGSAMRRQRRSALTA